MPDVMATDGAYRIMDRIAKSGHDQQSGAGTPHSIGSELWRSIVHTSERLFPGYTPISIGQHSCDLLPHVAAAIGVSDFGFKDKDKNYFNYTKDTKKQYPPPENAISVISMPYGYFSMGFVLLSAAMRDGVYLPVTEIQTDAAYVAGHRSPATTTK